VDGDLCEVFSALPVARQRVIAAELERSIAEVGKRLEDQRNKVV
jgi:splicing factor 3B subunit 3